MNSMVNRCINYLKSEDISLNKRVAVSSYFSKNYFPNIQQEPAIDKQEEELIKQLDADNSQYLQLVKFQADLSLGSENLIDNQLFIATKCWDKQIYLTTYEQFLNFLPSLQSYTDDIDSSLLYDQSLHTGFSLLQRDYYDYYQLFHIICWLQEDSSRQYLRDIINSRSLVFQSDQTDKEQTLKDYSQVLHLSLKSGDIYQDPEDENKNQGSKKQEQNSCISSNRISNHVFELSSRGILYEVQHDSQGSTHDEEYFQASEPDSFEQSDWDVQPNIFLVSNSGIDEDPPQTL